MEVNHNSQGDSISRRYLAKPGAESPGHQVRGNQDGRDSSATNPDKIVPASEHAHEARKRSEEISSKNAQKATQVSETPDRVEVSLVGQSMAESIAEDLKRSERIEELRKAYIDGDLMTPERIIKAAEEMLLGEQVFRSE